MLTLHYNGYDIPTGKDFSMRFSWKNPACFMNEIPGAAGLGIDIPVNDHSRAIFGNPERFEKYRTGFDRKYPGFEVRFGGMLLMSGLFVISNANKDTYSGWLQTNMGELGEKQRDKNISDMEWDPDGDRSFSNQGLYDDANDDYYPFNLLNGAFWNGIGRETPVMMEYTDEDGEVHKVEDVISYLTQQFRNNFGHEVNKSASLGIDLLGNRNDGEACVVSPYLFLRPLLRMLFKINSFFIERNDMVPSPDGGLAKYLVLYNNFNIMDQTFVTEEKTVSTYMSEENEWVDTVEQIISGTSWAPGAFRYADLVPRVALKDFIIGLQNFMNYIFVFRSLNKVDIIDRNAIISGDTFDLDKYFLGTWVVGERKDVTLKFISEFDKEDRMFAQEYHDFTDRRADFGEPVDTKDDLYDIASPAEGELRLVKDLNKIYEYKWKVVTSEDYLKREKQYDAYGWEFVSSGPQPFLHGVADEIEEIKSVFSTLQYTTSEYGFPIAVALQQGNLKKTKNFFKTFSPRLLNTFEIITPGALSWDGENGLFENRWKTWANFWKERLPVEGSFNLPLNVLYYVVNNITQKYSTVHGEFIIETIETEFGSNMIGTTRITGFKI